MSEVVKVVAGRRPVVVKRVPAWVDPGPGGGTPQPKPVIIGDATYDPIGTQPALAYARFTGPSTSLIEGGSTVVRAIVNIPSSSTYAMPVAVNVGLTTMNAANYTLSATEFVWAPGSLEATITVTLGPDAAEGTTRVLTLDLDPTSAPANPEHIVPATVPLVGMVRKQITALNAAAGTPSWTLPAATLTVPEGEIVDLEVSLDAPAPAPIQIRVQTSGGTAVENVDFELLDEVLEFPTGATTAPFQVRLTENTAAPAVDPTLRIIGNVLSGTANAGAHTQTLLTIVDNDAGGPGGTGSPFVSFIAPLSVGLLEGGESRTFTAQLASGAGTPLAFRADTEVPVMLAGAVTEFELTWPGTANRLFFPAGSSRATFVARARQDAPAGSSMTVTIQGPPAQQWQVGAANTVTLTATAEVVDPNRVFAASIDTTDGTRALRQFMMAVDPPSSTLPQYEIAGEKCQVVGHRRDAAGLWTGCYVYALTDGAESIPYVAGEQTVTLPTTGTLPPESASFVASPAVRIELQLNNGLGLDFDSDTADPGTVITWTHPTTGKWPQVGADIVRETLYVWRPRRQGTSGSAFEPSGDRAGWMELVETRIAGEDEIVLYRGRFANAAWKALEDPTAENPYTDGVMQVRYLLAEMGPAWRIEVFDAHPFQKRFGTADEKFYLLDSFTSGNHLHEFRPGASYHFWFVARRVDASAAAIARAEDYWEQRHIGWIVGALGATRKGLLSETGDLALDYDRAGFVNPLSTSGPFPGGGSGYTGIKRLGDQQMYGRPTDGFVGFRQEWVNGSAKPDGTGARVGWLFPVGAAGGGAAGGGQIYGSHALVPHFANWYRHRVMLAGIAGRHHNAIRDISSGEPAWWWRTAIDEGGEWRTPHISGTADRTNGFCHWHFSLATDPTGRWPIGSGTPDDLQLAPIGRAWNTPSGVAPDPTASARANWETFRCTHISRARQAFLEGWLSMRDPMAYRCWEEEGSRATRVYNPLPPSNFLDGRFNFALGDSSLWNFRTSRLANNGDVAGGFWWSNRDGGARTSQTARAYAWPFLVTSGLYAFASDELRASLRGEGVAASRGGRHWFRDIMDWHNRAVTPAGLPFAAFNSGATESWDEAQMGVTNLDDLLGAHPKPGNQGSPATWGLAHLGFQLVFFQRAIFAMLQNVLPSYPGGQGLVEHMRWFDHYVEGCKSRNLPKEQRWPFSVLGAIVPSTGLGDPFTFRQGLPLSSSGPFYPRLTVAEVRSGANAWPIRRTNPTSTQAPASYDIGWSEHFWKPGWLSDTSVRYFGDDSYDRQLRYVLDAEGQTDEQFVVSFMAAFRASSATIDGERWYRNYAEETFSIPIVARILNRYT